jgi:primosomal protein N'
MSNNHETRVYGDTVMCHICGKQWSTDDPDPPKCVSEHERRRRNGLNWIRKIRREILTK